MVVAGSTSVSTSQPSYSDKLLGKSNDLSIRSTTINAEVVDETRDTTLSAFGRTIKQLNWLINPSNQ